MAAFRVLILHQPRRPPASIFRQSQGFFSTPTSLKSTASPGKVLKRVRIAKNKDSGGGDNGGSWRDRFFKKKPPPDGIAPRSVLAKAFAGATVFQFAFGTALVTSEAVSERMDMPVPQEIMMVGLVVGMGSSLGLFRRLMQPLHWARYRWYVLLALSFIQVLPGAHMFVRKVLVPDMPVLDDQDLKLVLAASQAVYVKGLGFEAPPGQKNVTGDTERIARSQLGAAEEASQQEIALTVDEALTGWQQIFYTLSGGRELLLPEHVRIWVKAKVEKEEPDARLGIVEAAGLKDLAVFLTEPRNGPLLRAVFKVASAGRVASLRESPEGEQKLEAATKAAAAVGDVSQASLAVSIKEFTMAMVALQAAAEGNTDVQAELLWRLFLPGGRVGAGEQLVTRSDLEGILDVLIRDNKDRNSEGGGGGGGGGSDGQAPHPLAADLTEKGLLGQTRQIKSSRELAQRYISRFASKRQRGRGRGLCYEDFKRLCSVTDLSTAAFGVIDPLCGGAESSGTRPVQQSANVLMHLAMNPDMHIRKIK